MPPKFFVRRRLFYPQGGASVQCWNDYLSNEPLISPAWPPWNELTQA